MTHYMYGSANTAATTKGVLTLVMFLHFGLFWPYVMKAVPYMYTPLGLLFFNNVYNSVGVLPGNWTSSEITNISYPYPAGKIVDVKAVYITHPSTARWAAGICNLPVVANQYHVDTDGNPYMTEIYLDAPVPVDTLIHFSNLWQSVCVAVLLITVFVRFNEKSDKFDVEIGISSIICVSRAVSTGLSTIALWRMMGVTNEIDLNTSASVNVALELLYQYTYVQYLTNSRFVPKKKLQMGFLVLFAWHFLTVAFRVQNLLINVPMIGILSEWTSSVYSPLYYAVYISLALPWFLPVLGILNMIFGTVKKRDPLDSSHQDVNYWWFLGHVAFTAANSLTLWLVALFYVCSVTADSL